MTMRRHKLDTKTFAELSFSEQAKSINASINHLQKAMLYHTEHAKDKTTTRVKCLLQVNRLLGRLIEK